MAREKRLAPFGAWSSPITAELLARGGVRLDEVRSAGRELYWLETRPTEGGRSVVVRRDDAGAIEDLTPPGMNARTLVHEYGGGAYAVSGSTVFFANFADQRIYRQERGAAPVAITPAPDRPHGTRYADFCISSDGRRLYCVRETHAEGGDVVNEIAVLATDGSGAPTAVAGGSDFVSYPRLSPDGRQLAWTLWNHPQMPWDGTELWVGEVGSDGGIAEPTRVAGGPSESIYQPAWSSDGALHFVSDRTGWWNLYRWSDGEAEPLAPMEAEFGRAQWVFAGATYAFLVDGRLVCTWTAGGLDHIGVVAAASRGVVELETPWNSFGHIEAYPAGASAVALVAASASEPPSVVTLAIESGAIEVVKRSRETPIESDYLSKPQRLEFPSSRGRNAHALHYPPRNPHFDAPPGERPPLIVMSHGGPTAAATGALNLAIQFWTSRGFSVVDVNYGGSTGYGRAYRALLRGQWGVVDTEDCIHVARNLAERGLVDGARMAIRGGSAGGYTTLCALAFHDVFAAGASYYGVADAEALARDTHKFESRYLDSLIGPYPEARNRYRERSPIHFADRLSCPLLLLQGLEDEIVPPSQAEIMVEALHKRGLPYAYLAFEGEQHGFRKAENIIRAQEAELYFYARVFGFQAADEIEPPPIANADQLSAPLGKRDG